MYVSHEDVITLQNKGSFKQVKLLVQFTKVKLWYASLYRPHYLTSPRQPPVTNVIIM